VSERVLKGHTGRITAISITPDGKRAISGSWDTTVRVWNLDSGECERVLEGHTYWVSSVSITRDGRRAVSSGRTDVRNWSCDTGECEWVFDESPSQIEAVSITPDGTRAVSGSGERSGRYPGSYDSTVIVWDLETGECERVLERHTGQIDQASSWILAVSITRDGRRAVSGGNDSTVRVWNCETGECERVLEGHTDRILAVSTTSESWRKTIEDEDRMAKTGGLKPVRHNAPTVFDRLLASRASDSVLLTVGAISNNLMVFYRSVISFD